MWLSFFYCRSELH